MLIGIDVRAVQGSPGGVRAAGRYGRQLVDAMLARPGEHQFVVYAHEGLPLDLLPPASPRVAHRVLAAGPASFPDLLDENPDSLDWMLLLDPLAVAAGKVGPEAAAGSLKVASVLFDLGAGQPDEWLLASLRRHDAIFAVSAATAALCRTWLGSASSRVASLPIAPSPRFTPIDRSGPATAALGEQGIAGRYLLHVADPLDSIANIVALFQVQVRLPVEVRAGCRLVVVGQFADPGLIQADADQLGCGAALLLVPSASETQLRSLYSGCSAYIAALIEHGSGLPLVEAMASGAPVIVGREGPQAAIVGDAGLLVDPLDPVEVAAELAVLLGDSELDRDLRQRALTRAADFGWEPAVDSILAVLTAGQTPAATSNHATSAPPTHLRFDPAHAVRPRIAYFARPGSEASGSLDPGGPLLAAWAERFNIDFYIDRDPTGRTDRPPGVLGFDPRLFDRIDDLLDYHAVVHRVDDARRIDDLTERLTRRPGLVLLEDDRLLDAALTGLASDLPASTELDQIRALIRTGSILAVRSPWHYDMLHQALGTRAESIHLVPLDAVPRPASPGVGAASRDRLGLGATTLVIGQFVRPEFHEVLLDPEWLALLLGSVPDVVLLTFGLGAADHVARFAQDTARLGLADRFRLVSSVEADRVAEWGSLLDLVVHSGSGATGVKLLDLLRSGVPTLSPALPPALGGTGLDQGQSLASLVRDLALDPLARASLGRAGRDYVVGVAEPHVGPALLIDLIDRSAFELPRAAGRRLRQARSGPLPHFSRLDPVPDEAAFVAVPETGEPPGE